MTARPIPVRYWRRHGTGPLPSGAEALVEPFNAFPSWCAVRPGAHGEPSARGEVRDILAKMRTTAAAAGQGTRSFSPASRASAAGQCAGSCCATAEPGSGSGGARWAQ